MEPVRETLVRQMAALETFRALMMMFTTGVAILEAEF